MEKNVTLDPRHGTLALDMEPSTLEFRQKDRLTDSTNHQTYSSPAAQLGAKNKDFGAGSQTDLAQGLVSSVVQIRKLFCRFFEFYTHDNKASTTVLLS